MRAYSVRFLVLALAALTACKKEVEIRVEKPDAATWQPVRSLTDWKRVIISTGSTGNALLLQQPQLFTRLTGQRRSDIHTAASALSSDVGVRLALAPTFFAAPVRDTLLAFTPTADPVHPVYVNLRQLDPTLTRVQTHYLALFKCTAITRNNVLLAAYENRTPGRPFTFALFRTQPGPYYAPLSVSPPLRVSIPRAASVTNTSVRHLAAVDNYFLADLDEAGLYKIKEDGTARRVYGPAPVDAFYKWQGRVYAHVEYGQVLVSDDDGDTWQSFVGTPGALDLATFHVIGDSLVGNYSGQLYTLNWRLPNFRIRALKNDGLVGNTITGIEVLGDSVYAATLTGLFVCSRKTFFETKP